ncbi:glutaredoxin family protein [Pseudomonas aeruginosa]
MIEVTIYGASSCSDCKTFKTLAEAHNVECHYKLIDEDPAAFEMFFKFTGGRSALPYCSFVYDGCEFHTAGLKDSVAQLRLMVEVLG